MKIIIRLFIIIIICALAGVGSIYGLYLYIKPELPDVATLKDVKLQTPMLVYSADGKLISQFGEKRRIPLAYDQIPQNLIDALVATEDSRFYKHKGIDPIGIARAVFVAATSGSASQGASTITQQLARNFFLSSERKLMRKIKEAFIAIHIEQQLSKKEILELYVNKIFLGYRAYGFGAAAKVYFDKDINQLTLSEIAILAGLPKAPSTMNPLYSIDRATTRRNVVLARMLDEEYIDQAQFNQAKNAPIIAKYSTINIELDAPYVAEMARAWAVEKYGNDVYESGYKIYTTIDSKLQKNAQKAAINNLFAYDERHGYRGATLALWEPSQAPWGDRKIRNHLKKQPTYGPLIPAVVVALNQQSASVVTMNENLTLRWDGLKWARPFLTDSLQGAAPKMAKDILKEGQQIWVRKNDQYWQLSQVPDSNTALVSISPETGNIKALVGGFNFVHSKFNRATQSVRQVGSSIKPFIYAAALERGTTLATLINDAPINQWDETQGIAWRPKNSPAIYDGPTRVRVGLARSKNVMAVRLLRQIGLDNAINFLNRFGFKTSNLPKAESLALGSGSQTPLEMAQGYTAFSNGGYYMQSRYIDKVESPYNELIYKEDVPTICKKCGKKAKNQSATVLGDTGLQVNSPPQVISEQNAFLVREMLEANIWGGGSWRDASSWVGTGWRAKKPLNRHDIGGKTGTTNDSRDAWYVGYGPNLVTTVWMGFDDHLRTLGTTTRNENLPKDQVYGGESGGKTAQPAWIDYMVAALEKVPEKKKITPANIVSVRIDRSSGLRSRNAKGSTFEYFIRGTEPTQYAQDPDRAGNIYESTGEELF